MSKRIIKNIVMIVLIIVLCITMYFTVNGKRNNFEPQEEMIQKISEEGIDLEKPDNEIMLENGEKPEGMERRNGDFGEGTSMSEPPEKPEGEEFEKREMPEGMNRGEKNGAIRDKQTNPTMIILCTMEALGISILTIYLILSKFNKLTLSETLENKSKISSFIVIVILVTAIITMLVMLINKNSKEKFEIPKGDMMPMEENIEKTTKAEEVDSGEKVNTELINLSEYTSNITITESGSYTLTGEFSNTVLVDANGEVTLNLNNVKISNEITAALANISTNGLTINLIDGTTNTFSDGGSSDYDACIYSAGPITIKGNGNLEVYGNQEEGEGIATKTNDITIDGGNIKIVANDDGLNAGGNGGTIKINDGTLHINASGDGIDSNKNIVINGGYVYTIGSSKGGDAGIDSDDGTTINGGEVIALGSDMLEKPLDSSKQKVIATDLNTTISTGSELILKDFEGKEIISFVADDSFKTIIISNSKLIEGKYNLYKGTELVAELECK